MEPGEICLGILKTGGNQRADFSRKQREEFLSLAKHGVDFLMKHCLIAPDDWRCIFLLDEMGNPKYVEGCDRLDMSVYADCFVVGGLAMYAAQTESPDVYEFAKGCTIPFSTA